MSHPLLSRDSGESLIDQIVRSVALRIDDKVLRSGARMPSIRQFANAHGVSCTTVVASYDKLVAKGYVESRRGSGFFVRERSPLNTGQRSGAGLEPSRDEHQGRPLDVVWLIRNMFRQSPLQRVPGSGVLPVEWLDGPLIANALRSISRQGMTSLLNYGSPQGFLPLRQQLQLKLAELEIDVAPEQIVTTVGVTQALDLVAREFTRPGDTIFVDDPAWFLMFGSFAALGAKVVGIPRLADGPDLVRLAEMAARHKPKLYVINSFASANVIRVGEYGGSRLIARRRVTSSIAELSRRLQRRERPYNAPHRPGRRTVVCLRMQSYSDALPL